MDHSQSELLKYTLIPHLNDPRKRNLILVLPSVCQYLSENSLSQVMEAGGEAQGQFESLVSIINKPDSGKGQVSVLEGIIALAT